MKNLLSLVAAAASAAATMYYFDPDGGRMRRARLISRFTGVPVDVSRRPAWQDDANDARIRDTVRARLGVLASHPGSIHVSVEDGCVRLSGDVLAGELDALLTQVRDTPGVRRLVNAMSAHSTPQSMAQKAAQDTTLDEALAQAHPT